MFGLRGALHAARMRRLSSVAWVCLIGACAGPRQSGIVEGLPDKCLAACAKTLESNGYKVFEQYDEKVQFTENGKFVKDSWVGHIRAQGADHNQVTIECVRSNEQSTRMTISWSYGTPPETCNKLNELIAKELEGKKIERSSHQDPLKSRGDPCDQARKALDTLESDLLGCLPFNGNQRFILDNGVSSADGSIHYGPEQGERSSAADSITFRCVTSVCDTIQQVECIYELQRSTTGKTFALIRKVRSPNPSDPNTYDQPVKDGNSHAVDDECLCDRVQWFNIEYYASNKQFSELNPSPCPSADPLGDGDRKIGIGKGNDTGPTPYRIPQIRVSFELEGGDGKIYMRVIWIPMG